MSPPGFSPAPPIRRGRCSRRCRIRACRSAPVSGRPGSTSTASGPIPRRSRSATWTRSPGASRRRSPRRAGRTIRSAVTGRRSPPLSGPGARGDPRVLFVGKLLVSKGVDLLAAAWPLVHRARTAAGAPAPRILFIGFGAFEEGLRTLIDALERGDLEAARDVAARGRGLEGADQTDAALPILSGFLARSAGGLLGRCARGRRVDADRRSARARRGGRRDARGAHLRDAEHLARGVRDGPGRVGRLRRAADRRRPFRDARGRAAARRGGSGRSGAACSASRSGPERSPSSRIGSRDGSRWSPIAGARRGWRSRGESTSCGAGTASRGRS